MNIIDKLKKTLILLSCLVFTACFGSSCSDKSNRSTSGNGAETIQSEIIGKWLWKETTGGIAGIKSNPTTAGYIKKIAFNKNNTYEIYKNNKLTKKGSYKIIRKKAITGNEEYIIQYTNGLDKIVKISKDNMRLTENVVDGFSETYSRIK